MNIIVRGGVALSVLRNDLDCPFLSNFVGNLRPDMICEDLSLFHADPNTRDIFLLREWGRYNVMTIEDIEEELQEFTDPKIKWRSEDHRKKLFDYYTNRDTEVTLTLQFLWESCLRGTYYKDRDDR